MTAARRISLIAAGVVTTAACGLAFYAHWRTNRALRGPFRIGFFRSGFDHFPGPDGKPRGATVDILNEAARRRGMKLEWVYSPESADAALESGALDLWPNIGDIPERRGRVYVSLGYNIAKYGLLSRASNPVTWRRRWPGMVIARGAQNLERMYSERLFPSARFLTGELGGSGVREAESYRAVCSGRADAAIIFSPFSQFAKPPECRDIELHMSDLPDSMVMFGVGASYKRPWAVQAADALRAEMDGMAADSTLDEVAFRWNFRSPTEVRIVFYMLQAQKSTRRLRYAVGAAGLILVLLLWLTLRLRTARRDAEAARNTAESVSRSKSEFLANMSHEIRTPLNGVLGMTELALQTKLTAEQRDFLDTARGSAESLLAIINDILDFSKIEAGKMDLELLRVDLRELVDLAASAVVLRAHQKGIELVIDISPECPRQFQGDPTRIRQVLTNLLGNAVKFTERGEIVVRVSPAGLSGTPALLFAVVDTGIGIPLEKQRTIFEAFSQADASTTRKYGGTGLGLAICRRIVNLMGGRFWLESEAGCGSAFYFTVPVPELSQPSLEIEGSRLPASAPVGQAFSLHAGLLPGIAGRKAGGRPEGLTPQCIGARVLLVDDNATNRVVLERMLAEYQFQVTSVANAEEALAASADAAAAGAPFHVALLDYDMPGMSGLALARHLESNPTVSIPVILMLTSHDWNVTSARSRQIGVSTQVIKPVKPAALLEAVRKLLEPAPEAHEASAVSELPPIHQLRGLRILLAEDHAVNQRVAVKLLERSGHYVTVACNGKEAVDLFEQQPFDLVLMDIQMPEMDGFEAAAAIRAVEAVQCRPRVPIVALTAYAMRGDEARLFAGMDAHLPKPVRPAELDQVIARFAPADAPHALATLSS